MAIELERRFDFDGAAVAWTSFGDGPPMVLIHGTPFSAQVWRRLAPHLAPRRRVYLFDLLGYGSSAKGPGLDVSLGAQDRLLAALFVEWGLDRPDVLAHDFGGATALRGWLLQGLRYRTLTLIDPVAIAPWGSPFVAHVRAHEAAFAGLPDYAHRALLDAYLQGAVARPMREPDLAAHRAPWVGPVGQAAFYAQIAQMDQAFTDAIEPRLGEVDCPRALLWGAEDAWIPLAQGERLAARMGAGLTVVPGAGHLVQEDAPEAVLAAAFAAIAQPNEAGVVARAPCARRGEEHVPGARAPGQRGSAQHRTLDQERPSAPRRGLRRGAASAARLFAPADPPRLDAAAEDHG